MELLSQILLAISPVLVTWLTNLVKPSKTTVIGGYRATVLRFGVAFLSFGAVVGTAFLANQQVDVVSIETFVQAILVFFGASGIYFWNKYRKVTAPASPDA